MQFLILAAVTFFLHLVWESAHVRLYRDYDQLKGMVPVPVWASFGDVMYTYFAVLLIALFKSNILWFETATRLDFAGLAILGFCTALFVEYKAFYFKRWAYTEKMPVVPILKVGVSSLFQKSLLFPLSIFLASAILGFMATPVQATYQNASPDNIVISSPNPGAEVGTTFTVLGKARGGWYFEASFPLNIVSATGALLKEMPVQANGDWMNSDFVPFTTIVTVPNYKGTATLVLKNDNPSGLPENDASISIPLVIQ